MATAQLHALILWNPPQWSFRAILRAFFIPLGSASPCIIMPTVTGEGRDAGSLTVEGSAAAIDGTVYAQAFPGVRQLSDSVIGTGTSSVYGDERPVQAAPSQLPAGGFLFASNAGSAAERLSG